mgnify:CR=1 FL=1|jgi:hypothetical protein
MRIGLLTLHAPARYLKRFPISGEAVGLIATESGSIVGFYELGG